MVDVDNPMSIRRQCELLRVSRSGLYYEAEATSPEELELMRAIDQLHLRYPFFGSRKLGYELRQRGFLANRKRVQRLMRVMGIEALAPRPNTSKPAPEHVVYPYLLRNLRRGPGVTTFPSELLQECADVWMREPSLQAQDHEECAATVSAYSLLLQGYLGAFQQLTDRERFVLEMVEVRGLRYAELANVLQIRPEALKMVVFRARKRIVDRLGVWLHADGNPVS